MKHITTAKSDYKYELSFDENITRIYYRVWVLSEIDMQQKKYNC